MRTSIAQFSLPLSSSLPAALVEGDRENPPKLFFKIETGTKRKNSFPSREAR
jgi:hypothetical protein